MWKNVCSAAQTCNESAADAFTGQETNSRLPHPPPRFLTNAWCDCVSLGVLKETTTTTGELNEASGPDAPVETKLNIFNFPSIQPEVPGWMFLLAENSAEDGKKNLIKYRQLCRDLLQEAACVWLYVYWGAEQRGSFCKQVKIN